MSSTEKVPPRRRWGVWVAILMASIFALYHLAKFTPLQTDMAVAVRAAQSVRLEEFVRGEKLTVKELDLAQRQRLIDELPPNFYATLLIARCYVPHHRIVMSDTTGKEIVLEICFSCNEVRFDKSGIVMLPDGWKTFLRDLFSSHQVPIRPEEYIKIRRRQDRSE